MMEGFLLAIDGPPEEERAFTREACLGAMYVFASLLVVRMLPGRDVRYVFASSLVVRMFCFGYFCRGSSFCHLVIASHHK
jgi:hypothetical protein